MKRALLNLIFPTLLLGACGQSANSLKPIDSDHPVSIKYGDRIAFRGTLRGGEAGDGKLYYYSVGRLPDCFVIQNLAKNRWSLLGLKASFYNNHNVVVTGKLLKRGPPLPFEGDYTCRDEIVVDGITS
jgi:hypothetical protein